MIDARLTVIKGMFMMKHRQLSRSMFNRQNLQNQALLIHINTVYKAVHLLLLLCIAYNSSYLYAIFQELEQANQNNQEIVVNVNNNGQASAVPAKQSGTATQTKTADKTKSVSMATPAPAVEKKSAQASTAAPAEEPNTNPTTHKVEMLNNSPDGAMVFNPGYIHIKTGDSIEFQPVSYGHNVQTPEEVIGNSNAIPSGAEPFKGAMNEKLTVKFTKPGVYLYICNYHYIVGHVGVIQVGNNSGNLDDVRKAGEVLKGKIFSHPERVDQYLDMVKVF
jgi:pseudoazurin